MAHNTPKIPCQRPATDAETRQTRPDREQAKRPLPKPAALRTWWNTAWDQGGVLHERWEDLRQAPKLGWHLMANWIKALLAVAGTCFLLLLLYAAAGTLIDLGRQAFAAAPNVQIGTDTSTGVWAVVDTPIRTYIAQHSTGLAISGSTVYTLWQLAGLLGLVGGFFHIAAARLTWIAWGAASIAMIWTAAPADGRTIATGIAVIAWTLASAAAMRGMSLRGLVTHIHTGGTTKVDVHPAVHVPQSTAPDDGVTDDVHPLQR